MRIVTIDPGVEGTGVALWTIDWKLVGTWIFHSNMPDWYRKAGDIANQVEAYILKNDVHYGYIEFPALHQSLGGMVTARSGALVKLTFCAGLIVGANKDTPFYLVPVHKWKGQLPKAIVEKRIRKLHPEWDWTEIKSHAIDACGIGLFIKGELK